MTLRLHSPESDLLGKKKNPDSDIESGGESDSTECSVYDSTDVDTSDDNLNRCNITKFSVFPLVWRHPRNIYAVAFDVAKSLGLRDSYSMFQKMNSMSDMKRINASEETQENPLVLRKIASTEKERGWLLSHNFIAPSMRSREVCLVDVSELAGICKSLILKKGFSMKDLDKLLEKGIVLPVEELESMVEKSLMTHEMKESIEKYYKSPTDADFEYNVMEYAEEYKDKKENISPDNAVNVYGAKNSRSGVIPQREQTAGSVDNTFLDFNRKINEIRMRRNQLYLSHNNKFIVNNKTSPLQHQDLFPVALLPRQYRTM